MRARAAKRGRGLVGGGEGGAGGPPGGGTKSDPVLSGDESGFGGEHGRGLVRLGDVAHHVMELYCTQYTRVHGRWMTCQGLADMNAIGCHMVPRCHRVPSLGTRVSNALDDVAGIVCLALWDGAE